MMFCNLLWARQDSCMPCLIYLHVHYSPKEVHIDLLQISRWRWVTDPDLGPCQFCQMVFTFWHGVFCELLSRPIDKIKMTRGQGRWPRDLRKLGSFSCALLSKKSAFASIGDSSKRVYLNILRPPLGVSDQVTALDIIPYDSIGSQFHNVSFNFEFIQIAKNTPILLHIQVEIV